MPKILIIDEEALVRDSLDVFLTKEGHEVRTAADSEDGLQAFKDFQPDLVILARQLPSAPGPVVLARLRVLSKTVPVIMLAGRADPADAEACLAAGASCVFPETEGLSAVLAEVARLAGRPTGAPAAQERHAAQPPAARRGNGLILVADDDRSMIYVLARALAEAGYSVISATDGVETERLAYEARPDIILLDITMPERDGLTVLKNLTEKMPEIGILMITGNEDEELARACLQLGAFDYAQKPLNLETLNKSIKARLLQQKARYK